MREGSRNTPVMVEEMKREKEVIKQVHDKFRPEYKAYAIKKRGMVSNKQINILMDKAIKKVTLTQEQEEVVQGFYDTYLGMLFAGGSDMAEGFAHNILG